jgi:hypothetical protein
MEQLRESDRASDLLAVTHKILQVLRQTCSSRFDCGLRIGNVHRLKTATREVRLGSERFTSSDNYQQ